MIIKLNWLYISDKKYLFTLKRLEENVVSLIFNKLERSDLSLTCLVHLSGTVSQSLASGVNRADLSDCRVQDGDWPR